MDWLGAATSGLMVAVRALHFAATAVTAGSLIFRAVASPRSEQAAARLLRNQTLRIARIALAITLASGAIWFPLQAMSMSGLPPAEALTPEVLLEVVNQTQFGLVIEIRFVLALVLAVGLSFDRLVIMRWLGLVSALCLTAAIAWTGHAAATIGKTGLLQLTADVLHLIAAAAWVGGLVSLVWLMTEMRHGPEMVSLVRDVIRRFSTLGIAAVGTLLLSGAINSWFLAGSFRALAVTGYGRLLTLKIALFAVMVAFAAVNRLRLTPRLGKAAEPGPQFAVLDRLKRNSLIEIALGFTIFVIVAALGTLHPGT